MLLSFLSFSSLLSFDFWIIVSSFVSKILPTVKLLTLNTHGCARDEEKFCRVVISAMPNHRVSQICTDTSSKEKRRKVSATYTYRITKVSTTYTYRITKVSTTYTYRITKCPPLTVTGSHFLSLPIFSSDPSLLFPSRLADPFFCTERESPSCTRPCMPALGIANHPRGPKSHLEFWRDFQSKMEAHDRLANLGNLTVSHQNNRVITFKTLQ